MSTHPTGNGSPVPTSNPVAAPTPQRRTRSERVALHSASRGVVSRFLHEMQQEHQGILFLTMLLTAVAMSVLIRAWDPPFTFRQNDVTERAIVCNTAFSVSSPEAQRIAEARARAGTLHIYVNDRQPLVQLRQSLANTVAALVNVRNYDLLEDKTIWDRFLTPSGKETLPEGVDPKKAFDEFIAYFKDDTSLDSFNTRLNTAFMAFEVHGVLGSLSFGPDQGSQEKIRVYQKGQSPDAAVEFRVNEVLIRDGSQFRTVLQRALTSTTLVDQLCNWLLPQLSDTLKEDKNATADAQRKAATEVGDVHVEYVPGQTIVEAGATITAESLALLKTEYNASVSRRHDTARILRFNAICVVLLVLLVLCWGFVRRRERRRPKSPRSFITLMSTMVLTVAMARLLQGHSLTNAEWEIMPLLLFVMSVSITYSWELAIVFSTILILTVALGSGGGIPLLIVLLAVTVSAAIQLGRLRSRRKLLVVSSVAGAVAFILTVAIGLLTGKPLEFPLLMDASINLFWSLLAGLVMTGLLPFIEGPFGILTDMSLLELGDVSHPLLQSLIRLAPATYGHAMQVGTIAETAAEAIGARGLLTRVGAYFHDIGKIMKPEYYSENQGGLNNIHDQLEPQVSTIVVIAHVKDGVDLARQHRLPTPLIDLIEQHHGTSLVSFFYGRAAGKAAGKEDQPVEESTYRYPGPKPRTKEAAILMIADSCESACRSMGAAATPGKIENKVRVIIKQKLDDGQFDDSGLTFRELKVIENSVIKSIIAAMHGRIRYPGQVDHDAPRPPESSQAIPIIQLQEK